MGARMSATRRNLLLALVILSGILNYADRQIIAVLKTLLQAQLNWTDADYGDLTTLFQFAAALAYVGAGWVVDRVGWRRANILAVATWSLAAMAHGVVRTFGQFAVARVALGATESLGTPTAIKTIGALFEARARSFAMGAMNSATNIGAVITPLLVPSIAVAWGWQAAFLLTGGLGLVWVAAWVLTTGIGMRTDTGVPAGNSHAEGDLADRSATVPGAQAVAEVPAPSGSGSAVSWRQVLVDRRTWAIAGAKVLIDQVWWLLLFWIPDFFHRQFHLDIKQAAVPTAAIYLIAACGSIIGGWASGRLIAGGAAVTDARKTVMLVSALLMLPVPLALFVDDYWLAVAFLGLTLASHQAFSVNLFALTTDVVPGSRVGTVISVGALCGNLSGMTVLWVASRLIGKFGYGPWLGLAAVAYLLALAWIRRLIPRDLEEIAAVA
jgi:ACS family hexuronate transporter-like MFS transporter